MTLREQLLKEIEIAPDNLLEELLTLCRERNRPSGSIQLIVDHHTATALTPPEAIKRLQAKLRLVNPSGQSLVDELIAERRSEVENE